ncbi:hypothetical protein GOP47_0018999 [Adiantum capillus-veneris]|uniref:CW-type domain-containing protein n=1 Tax=Adiantum capillus-veneris TaxID=13818 RepID=A0A9D4UEK6_ADICA|nr:hypothetical protein GOP47_0018999 [Adiantum capillus-veneris]
MDSTARSTGNLSWRGILLKDNKPISDIQSYRVPFPLPSQLTIEKLETETICPLNVLPSFQISPLGANPARVAEWKRFLTFLLTYRKVAYITIAGWELLINPPAAAEVISKQAVVVSYRLRRNFVPACSYVPIEPVVNTFGVNYAQNAAVPILAPAPAPVPAAVIQEKIKSSSFAQTHPSYLETLGQNHASWIFGALAELIDNARDAKASRLDISIDQEFLKSANSPIPVLSVRDNGTGMTHAEILRMISFGHKKPDEDDENLIGRFGVGFKTGSMRLGKDVVVLTQSAETRSIAFLSQTYNKGNEEVEIPVITYRKEGGWMEFDLKAHSQAEAEARLKAVKDYSPFNEYSIGSRFAAFGEHTGTIVCVFNLDRWGANYALEWDPKGTESERRLKRDIWIRSRRVRTRPSQMTKSVPLDYSLHAYLEVMFLEPKMKIYIQGTLVRTRRLHKSLNKTKVLKDIVLGKKVELTLGRSQAERDVGNCGIFLYWHGRLIEAYKRVGAMLHSADVGRGVIGVIDVTDVMRSEDGVGVLNNKQGFQDCVAYAHLEDWLATMADSYWDENYDRLTVGRKDENAVYTPDHSWVQCNRCLKWRILEVGIEDKELPDEWFCYMPPFRGSCMDPECEADAGVVTVGATRTYAGVGPCLQEKEDMEHSTTACNSTLSTKELSDASDDNMKSKLVKPPVLRRLKRGPATTSKGRQSAAKKICKGG